MRIASSLAAAAILLSSPIIAVRAQAQGIDWGGGYLHGGDSASTTVATSGAGPEKPAAVASAPAPVNLPLTDWGGGYLRGGDSASTTMATSGAGTPQRTK